MTLTALTRVVALLSVLVVLGAGAATAGHHHEEEGVQHDCALCTVGSLNPFVGAQSDLSPCLAAALSLSPGPQGPPLCALYRAYLLSRAPPRMSAARPQILFATASFVRAPKDPTALS